ncbi:hypothetical protein HQ393_11600 [Chitinibacter bivalviorum]|uniref:Tetratricopeptide repeat protein n=1 Tax=Chitinibacter bivalviorum TaxID=2739434 RepID=A0A7H9BJH4_9NEIS|nr:hypothetical protein [Chitinibacter bivalviorum]QLG88825.1 hypothetical protein HQ393_11600 [Chitinibacter bivalviorum]
MSAPASPPRQHTLDLIDAHIFTDPVLARGFCMSLLQETREAFDIQHFIAASLRLSLIEDQLGDFAQAIEVLSEAMAYAQEFKLFQEMPAILEQLGCCHYSLAHYPPALSYWQQCVLLCGKQASLAKTRGLAMVGLGRICDVCGQNQLAVTMHEAGHTILLATEDAFLITMAKINWAVNLFKLQQYAAARVLLNQALAMSHANQLPHHVAECHFRLAQIAMQEGALEVAESEIEEGLLTVSTTPYHWVEVNLLAEWGELVFHQGDAERAMEIVRRGLLIAQEDGLRHLEMRLVRQAERYCHVLGIKELAAEYGRQVSFLQLHLHAEMPSDATLDLTRLPELVA